ncbi:MAG: hypothetical protein JXB30_10980 [Anaerolineae bacterium]|nr:hypothetical protein [Anaerolineae bacterium]
MPVEIEKLPDEPIIVATMKDPFDPGQDIPAMFAEFTRLRLEIENDVALIIDIRGNKAAFSQVMVAMAKASRGIRDGKAAGVKSPPIIIFVGSGILADLAANAMAQKQYGGVKGHLCTSTDEALALAREILAAKKGQKEE